MTTYFLSDAQLAKMRSDVARMLPGTAIIQAFVATTTNGRTTETWTAVSGGTVSCRCDPMNQRSQIETAGGAEGFKVEWQLTLPYNAPIVVGNRVVYDGDVYQVRQLSENHSWQVSTRAIIARVK